MPSATSLTSAPTSSQKCATALMKLTFVARNALATYLIVSADAGSVMSTGACSDSYSSASRMRGFLVVGADHDAVGVERVVQRLALAEELGVRHDVDVVAAEQRGHAQVRADRDGRLVDHDGVGAQVRTDLARHRLDVAEVGGAVLALRRRQAQEHELGSRTAGHRAEHERRADRL